MKTFDYIWKANKNQEKAYLKFMRPLANLENTSAIKMRLDLKFYLDDDYYYLLNTNDN
jgi:hypothetical protein